MMSGLILPPPPKLPDFTSFPLPMRVRVELAAWWRYYHSAEFQVPRLWDHIRELEETVLRNRYEFLWDSATP